MLAHSWALALDRPEAGLLLEGLRVVKWCLHKNADRVEVTALADPARMFLCISCDGMRAVTHLACPRCGDEIPPEDDATGEGPVYWKISGEAFCSMECVIYTHREWCKTAEGQKALKDGRC